MSAVAVLGLLVLGVLLIAAGARLEAQAAEHRVPRSPGIE